MEEVQSRHRKEVKAWDGEKRAALKKAKALKGKKGKETLESVEKEYAEKFEMMQQRHQQEVQAVGGEASEPAAATEQKTEATEAATAAVQPDTENETSSNNSDNNNSKLEKARRKREKQKELQLKKEAEIAAELQTVAAAGPTAREAEMKAIQAQLDPLGLQIGTIPADGHCLYRAVQAQVTNNTSSPVVMDEELVWQMRNLCANALLDQAQELGAFLEYTDEVPDLETYVNRVRTRADCWGGHVELRALSTVLKRPIHVYQAAAAAGGCLVIDDSGHDESGSSNSNNNSDNMEPIRLSYHLRYYSLGEHYNQVIAKK